MKNTSKQIDRKILKTLEPLNRLNPILLDELAAKSIIDEVPAGKIICRHGEKDSRQIYLLSGQIEAVKAGESKTKVIKSKSALKTPLAEGSPRTITLKAKTNSTLLYIDADLLELLMSDEPELNATYEVTEITEDDSDDWMLSFLQSPAFLQLPTENIQKLLTHMEEIPAKKDQIIIEQGATDDNYYIIKSGSCNVHRQPYKNSASVLLAVLPSGSGFGEEALISNGTRNATITMRENGLLMRLKKKDFLNLLINPLISYFEHSETQQKLNQGCVVIDVRSEKESQQKPLEGAVNIPLSMLRLKFDSLNNEREYLLVCDDGSQSAAAAFLMIQHGMKCSVLKNGLNNSTSTKTAGNKLKNEELVAKKQTEQIAAQQQQIKAAREKAEQDILKHKKELADSRARIAKKKQVSPSSAQLEAAKLKEKAAQELAKAQAESEAIKLRRQETTKNIQRAEEMMKQSAAAAEKTRQQAQEEAALIKQRAIEEAEALRAEKAAQELAKAKAEAKALELKQQAEQEAALIKQRALEEAEALRAEKAAQALAKAQAEKEAIALQQKETNEAMLLAEKARKQAEAEAELIKQRAIEEAEHLRAEVEAARQKMEQDAARIKEEEKIIKKSALNMRNEADKIRREAMNEAQQVRAEIESTRALLEQKLKQTEIEEKRQHDAILAEAKKQADKIAASKTEQAIAEAEAIRQKAKEDALRLHNELESTRQQIEAEAAQVISELKERSQTTIKEDDVTVIEEEVVVELVTESAPAPRTDVDYKSVSIPGMSTVEPINDELAKRKAQAIKEKLTSTQNTSKIKVHKKNERTILEGEEDLFIFQQPGEVSAKPAVSEEVKRPDLAVSHRTRAESEMTQISIEPQKSVVIYPQQETETAYRNNQFLNQEEAQPVSSTATPHFDIHAHNKKHQSAKSNTFAIAASFLLILAGAVFTLHATNTLKVQSIAAMFNSGNDTVQTTTAIAKTKNIHRKVLRADSKVNVKKKVTNKMDDIMQGWKEVLSEAKNPKKRQ